jgi:hypothetical protein
MRLGVPCDDGRLSYGGYDSSSYPVDGAAWVETSAPEAFHLTASSKGRGT